MSHKCSTYILLTTINANDIHGICKRIHASATLRSDV